MTNIIALLHRAGQRVEVRFGTARGDDDITARQQAVLAALLDLEEASQTGLVEATGIDRSTMADLVRRLTRNGLVTRKRTRQDARRYAVRATGAAPTMSAWGQLATTRREVTARSTACAHRA